MRMFIVLIGTAVLLSLAAPAQDSSSPTLEYARDASTIVIQVDSRSAMPAGDPDDTTPKMRIYGNGRVLVHRSTKPKGERSYESWLSDAEMAELLRFLYNHGAMQYEYGVIKEKARVVELQSRIALPDGDFKHTRSGVSDGSHTSIEISLKSFRPVGSAEPAQSDFTHRTGGYALAFMAKEYPEVEEAQNLAAVQARLVELIRSPDLRRTSAPAEDQE